MAIFRRISKNPNYEEPKWIGVNSQQENLLEISRDSDVYAQLKLIHLTEEGFKLINLY
ncbi:hypothetical protein [Ureibacillus sp. FSL K6-0786]|uniref:hypothetical protein n=1 Tax=Ureibacillus sp. FSL K6-0786 TaxID=2954607 RepID=UPI0030D88199